MTIRTWLFDQLNTIELLGGPNDPRVFAKKSMSSSIEEHPYAVYKFGNNTNYALSEERPLETQFIQIFVHDYADTEVGDYMQIDAIIAQLKIKLTQATSKPEGIQRVQYLETSQDLNDETLNTVMKYIRFALITEGVTP